ncbi:MAG TPA: DUF2207 domain-containing protein [Thermomicrobiales bacterium]|nr:DUF2207 domain-containing protein [Thermomicrobiales bacterium]
MRIRWLIPLLLLVALAAPVGLGAPAPAASAEQAVRYNRFDVDIAIDPSGNFRVTETQAVAFLSGTFHTASRTIDMTNVVDIQNIALSEGGTAYSLTPTATNQADTFTTSRSGANLKILWNYPPTSGATRTWTLAYTVIGGLRISPDTDVLDWVALPPGLAADVAASTVTVHLPGNVDQSKLQLDSRGAGARSTVVDPRTVRFTAGSVPQGKGLEIKVGFPHGLVSAAPPPWQARFEQQAQADARQAAYRNLVNLLLGALGLFILIGGGIGLYLLWYLRGRDRYTGLVADYLREPPSDLGPGTAGTLLDERADLQDVLATFTDLGRRGVLRIGETNTGGFLGTGLGASRDYAVEKLDSNEPLTDYERTLVGTLFPGDATQVRLSEAKQRFTAALPYFKSQLYREVVDKGFFTVSPETTRSRYRALSTVLMVLAVGIWLGLNVILAGLGSWQIVPAAALFIIGLAMRSLANAMPAKTERGAEEAAKWRAFRRYLENLEKYDDVAASKGIFEKYLPYATAFGLDKSWIKKFAAVDTPAPSWWGGPMILPVPVPGGYYGPGYYGPGGYYGGPMMFPGGQHQPGNGGQGGGDGWSPPSLQDLSDAGGGGLQSMSDSLMGMLDSAASVFGGGGNQGGGGGSFGGWSGGGFGGGGGFSGGGGGSSGGGSSFG